jgi:SsrA-binding protein
MAGKAGTEGAKTVVVNKKARFNYAIEESFEAGLVLTGSEIKSIREGRANIAESYIRPVEGELFLVQAHITEYSHSHDPKYDPLRKRKLLMHKREIEKLSARVEAQGFTLVPLSIYLKRGKAKLQVALAKGKAAPDKRRVTRERELDREASRAMKRK